MQVPKVSFLKKFNSNQNSNLPKSQDCIPQSFKRTLPDTVSFGTTSLKPNQVLPSTEKMIQRAVKQTKLEQNKIIKALNKTWESFAMGKESSIYMGNKELPLDKYQVEWLHQSIQLTSDLPGKKRVFFVQNEPNRFMIHVDSMEERIVPKHSDDVMYDIDYRVSREGAITEFVGDSMTKETNDSTEIKKLNDRVQFYLKALFPKKEPKQV